MALTWNNYLDKCVARLTDCRDKDDFQQVLDGINDEIDDWSISEERRDWFWNELEKRYKEAPKLILKEATAAVKLNQLTLAAEQLLAAARKR